MLYRHLKPLGLAAALCLGTALALAQEATFKTQTEIEVVPGQFIVKNAPGAVSADVSGRLQAFNLNVVDSLPLVGAQVVSAPGVSLQDLVARTAKVAGIAYIEPVYVVRANATPNDPRYPQQWGFPQINAPDAWDMRTDSDDIVVAVIDTGVDYQHPDLAANMWKNPGEVSGNGIDDDGNGIIDDVFGANFVPTTASGDPMDDNRHGTHVAGTIGAVTGNNLGVAGVNWKTRIMAVKFLSASGSGTTAGAIRGIEYAIKMGADILNNSWGGGGFSRALEDAIRSANDKGILFVAAAGNAGRNDNDVNPHYPSSYDVPNVLAVMATDRSDAKASFSSFGATSVDLGAPGVDILSTIPGGGYDSFNGTSMATPHVAGAAAMVRAEHPSLSVTELKQRLMDSAEVVPALFGLSVTGARLDLLKALTGDRGPGGECNSDRHAHIAYEEFFWSENREVDQNSNLLSATFELPDPMVVDFAAHGSARRVKGTGNTLVRTGVYTGESPNVMWTGSYRRANFDNAGENRTLSSDFSIVLPAGQHTIYWKIWVSNATLRFDSGTLTIRAFPCSMGGKLSLALAAETGDLTEADPSYRPRTEDLGVDVKGNSITTAN